MKKYLQSKISFIWSFLIIAIGGATVSAVMIFFLMLGLPGQGSSISADLLTTNQDAQNLMPEKPVAPVLSTITKKTNASFRLKISKLSVDAAIESVGLTSKGTLDVPKGPNNVAWYKKGPRPGATGSSVIDGHFGWWKDGTETVFNNLYKLQKGDKISVEDAKGNTTTFIVRESRSYSPNADASAVFVSNDGKAHLNLITCEGDWNKNSKSYSKRLVVFTDKE